MVKILNILDNEPFGYGAYYGVTWEVTANCNFKCRYCSLNKEEEYQNPEKIITFINNLNKSKKVSTTLFGGEPTQHPEILSIIQKLESHLQLFTNLSKPLSFYKTVLDIKPDLKLETTYHDDQNNFDIFYDKVKELSALVKDFVVYLMWDTNYNHIKENYEKLKNIQNVQISILKVSNGDQSALSSEDSIWLENKLRGDNLTLLIEKNNKIVKEQTTVGSLYSRNLNNFKFFKCSCGENNMYISSTGKCYPCLDYKKENKSFYDINNPNEEQLSNILSRGITCSMDLCTSEVSAPKKRIINR